MITGIAAAGLLIAFMMLFTTIPASQAELREFIIELDMEKGAIHSGDTLTVTGRVVDHAYQPTRGIEVLIRTGVDTVKTFTDPTGSFKGEFKDFDRVPGMYIINVAASWYGMTGMTSTEFQVAGDATPVLTLQQKLSTDEARKYLSADIKDFEKNPIGQTLYKYYHKLHKEMIYEIEKAAKPDEQQVKVEEQRKTAETLKDKAIKERKPRAGTYGDWQYEKYINGLNPEISDLIRSQLNFTKNNFEEAQKARDEIIANGGTVKEAREIYLKMIAVPKHVLEQFNQEYMENNSKETKNK